MRLAAVARVTLVLGIYLLITAVYTHPLLQNRRDAIANDRYDPVLNASILWWNATRVPFSPQWWTPPHYYPSEGIAAFTENLAGLGVLTTPMLWLTQDPVQTYNLAVYLTWPLSAMGVYLLLLGLQARAGPAFVGGLAFGFAPYRIAQMGHLQVLACFWLPLALLGLHLYREQRRRRWLVLFGTAWLLQSLTNGYFMLFGAVLIGLWIAYFCSTAADRRLALPIVGAWTIATLPLVPVLLQYRDVHARYGLTRGLGAIVQYSAEPWAWLRVSELAQVWRDRIGDAGGEANLFPGLTGILIVLAAGVFALVRPRSIHTATPNPNRRLWYLRRAALVVAIISASLVVVTLFTGPWRVAPLGLPLRMSSVDRALFVALAAGAIFFFTGDGRRRLNSVRGPLFFYGLATVLVAVFCMGPQVRFGNRVLLDTAPYAWLLVLPGFDGLRVPTRFWMIGALCLGTAAGLALDRVAPTNRGWRAALVVLLSCGVLADGWLREMPMATPPQHWPEVEAAHVDRAILELPLGPEWDAAATFRAVRHRRRVVNGVSGYDPPHYGLLQRGLNAHDPAVLQALATLGPIDVIVDGSQDAGGGFERYVSAIPGVERIASDGTRTAYRLPSASEVAPSGSRELAITALRSSGNEAETRLALDNDPASSWRLVPQTAASWIVADLGREQPVAGVIHSLGTANDGYPRRLAIDLSTDGLTWNTVWEGAGAGPTLLAVMRTPLEGAIRLLFEPRPARFVRLRLTADADAAWTLAELRVLAPAAAALARAKP
jgi:hypothetical protein